MYQGGNDAADGGGGENGGGGGRGGGAAGRGGQTRQAFDTRHGDGRLSTAWAAQATGWSHMDGAGPPGRGRLDQEKLRRLMDRFFFDMYQGAQWIERSSEG